MKVAHKDPRWVIGDAWRDRLSGRSCILCDELRSGPTSSLGLIVRDLRVSRWILGRNQYVRGYSLLLLDRHAIELFELDEATRHQFIDDIAEVSAILRDALDPIKINVELQGNVIPHLHCHVKPRFPHDVPGHARIFQDEQTVELSPGEMSRFQDDLRGRRA